MGRPTIVFIDDEQQILAALKREMVRYGVNATCVSHPDQLFQMLQNDEVAMVVSDLHMPEVFGLDLLEEVKARFPGVLRAVLTGNADTDTILRSVNSTSVTQFIKKPWDSRQLTKLADLAKAHCAAGLSSVNEPSDEQRNLFELEQQYPGITGVTRGADGVIRIYCD